MQPTQLMQEKVTKRIKRTKRKRKRTRTKKTRRQRSREELEEVTAARATSAPKWRPGLRRTLQWRRTSSGLTTNEGQAPLP